MVVVVVDLVVLVMVAVVVVLVMIAEHFGLRYRRLRGRGPRRRGVTGRPGTRSGRKTTPSSWTYYLPNAILLLSATGGFPGL